MLSTCPKWIIRVLGYAHFYYVFYSLMYKLPPWLYRYALDLLQQTRRNVQGYAYNEYYLYDIHTSIGMKSAD